MTKFSVFTIASKNFLAFVQALNDSLQRHHPGTPFYCILCDDCTGLDIHSFPFEIIPYEKLGIPNIEAMRLGYNITELNTALKPFAFSLLFDEHPDSGIIYLDPDIYIYSELRELLALLDDGADAVLIPHITGPAEYAEMNDREFLRYGIYNLGFCAFRATPETRRTVSWWGRRLESECKIDLANGLFVDQKWADLIPAFVSNTIILRHPGYNVAYWNLSERKIRASKEGWLVNGKPLRFFHFSGGSAEYSAPFSRHSSMFTLARLGQATRLVQEYRDAVQGFGHRHYERMEYAFSWGGSAGKNTHTPKVEKGAASEFPIPFLPTFQAETLAEYRCKMSSMARLLSARREIEATLASNDQKIFEVKGFCFACAGTAQFQAGDYDLGLSWNDKFICGRCRLSGRLRGVLQVFRQILRPQLSSRILALDCDNSTLLWLHRHFSEVTAREYLTARHSQHPEDKFLNKRLPFDDDYFDYILALGDYSGNLEIPAEAIQEFYRVVAPGGAFVLASVGSDPECDDINSGCAEKKDEAASAEGPTTTPTKLLFDDWRTIDSLKQAGYPAAHLLSYWSFEQKILGDQRAIIAQK